MVKLLFILLLFAAAFWPTTLSLAQSGNLLQWKKINSNGILEKPEVLENRTKKSYYRKLNPVLRPIISEYKNFTISYGKLKPKSSAFSTKLEVNLVGPLTYQVTDLPNFSYKDYLKENIQYLDKAHGLFSNMIVTIEQDQDGYMWIGSENDGIIKIDGGRAWAINKQGGLISNVVYMLFSDSKNRMWVGTDKGLAYISNDNVYKIKGSFFEKVAIKRIKEDNKGNIWVAVDGKGLYKISDNEIEEFSMQRGLFGKSIEDMFIDRSGEINIVGVDGWTVINGSQIKYVKDKGTNVYDFMPVCVQKIRDQVWLGGFSGSSFYWQNDKLFKIKFRNSYERCFQIESSDAGIWFADYSFGMILLQNDGTLKFYGTAEGLAGKSSYHFKIDHNKNVWVADPFAGVSLIKLSPFRFRDDIGIALTKIKGRANGSFWLSYNGTSISLLQNDSIYHYNTKGGLGKYTIDHCWDYIEDDQGDLWMSTHGMGVAKMNAKTFDLYRFKTGNIILDLTEDAKGNYWFSTYDAGIRCWDKAKREYRRLTNNDGLVSNFVRSSTLDHLGRLWICTDEGVNVLDGERIALLNKKRGLGSSDLNCMFEDRKGRIWLASNDAGVNIIVGNKILKLDKKSGLVSDRVVQIVENDSDEYWVVTTSGLSLMKDRGNGKFTITNYDYRFGSFMQDFYPGIQRFYDGKIWFGTQQGLVEFNPEFQKNREIARFKIEKMWLNGTILNYTKKRISATTNSKISVDFSLFNWGVSNDQKVYYSMVKSGDRDTNWIEIPANLQFQINNLNVGYFQTLFKLKAGDMNQFFTGPVLLLSNPWYRSVWFNVLVLIILLIGVWIIFAVRTRLIKSKKEELEKIVEERTAELEQEKLHLAQANLEIEKKVNEKDVIIYEMHHRVKNNLQTISSLIDMQMRSLKEERERSVLQDTVRRISAMSASHELLYASDDLSEISLYDFITHLLSLQERFIDHPDKKLNIIYEIPELSMNISHCIDLGMIISEAVSNAIKHAFASTMNPELRIAAKVLDNNCVLSIIDNGIGIEREKQGPEKNTLGLRLMKIFASKLKGEIVIENNHPGTKIELTFPLNKK